jgi:hypothetical protein
VEQQDQHCGHLVGTMWYHFFSLSNSLLCCILSRLNHTVDCRCILDLHLNNLSDCDEIVYCLHEVQIMNPVTSRDILLCHCCPHKSIPFLFGNDSCCFQEDLDALQGMKCQAPYKHEWGDVSYHNALVCAVEPTSSVHSMSQIQVLVCS